jgi:hypothetical protein
LITKLKIEEINIISKIMYVPSNNKNKSSIRTNARFNVEFFPNVYLIKNLKTKEIILKGSNIIGKGLY